MSKTLESKSIEQLLAEADELIRQINSDSLIDLKAEHRLQVEKHAQYLKKMKSDVQAKIKKKEAFKFGSAAEGMYEALQDIAKAMGELKDYISGNRPDTIKDKTDA